MRRPAKFLAMLMLAVCSMTGCSDDEEEVCQQPPPPKRKPAVRVRAPFTNVDVYLPDDDEDDVDVDVDVDVDD